MLSARSIAGSVAASMALLSSGARCIVAQALPPLPLSSPRASAPTPTKPGDHSHRKNLALPMAFEARTGSAHRPDDFVAQGPGYRLSLSPAQATFQLADTSLGSRSASKGRATPNVKALSAETLTMQLVGADHSAHTVQNALPTGHANYFLGSDRSRWRTDVPLYDRVRYSQVYRGIDLVYYGDGHQLEYDFLVRPGTDPKQIRLAFPGTKRVRIAANGDLVLGLKQREVRWHRPLTYQVVAGKKRTVASAFRLKPGGEVGFALGRYDASHALVIDPKLLYSKTLGSGAIYTSALAVDGAGNTYVAGSLSDSGFPVTPGAYQTRRSGAFVAKLNPEGTGLIYATYLGGTAAAGAPTDGATAIAVDAQGNAYVTGNAGTFDFPVTPGAFQTTNFASKQQAQYPDFGYSANAFVTKLNAAGSALLYSTYLGGHTRASAGDTTNAIVVDGQGSAYVAGLATSQDFPTTPGAYQSQRPVPGGFYTGFVTKLNASGTALVYSTFLAGSQGSACNAIALGRAGDLFIAGGTTSTDFPVTPGAFQATNRHALTPYGYYTNSGFVTHLNAAGSAPLYSTYLGGSGNGYETVNSIAVDKTGSAFVTGFTGATDFPTTVGAFQRDATYSAYSIGGAFVTKLTPDGAALLYSTYLGGGEGTAIAVDSAGNACVLGGTDLTYYPTTPGSFPRPQNTEGFYSFLAKLNTTGTALLYATYLPGLRFASGLALDSGGNATVSEGTVVERLSTYSVFPDFNDDGRADLLLRNQNSGAIAVWFLEDANVVGGVHLSQTPPASYRPVGVGDFRSDGSSTLVFQDSSDNRVVLWYTGGPTHTAVTGGDYVDQTPAAGWKVVGVADFNRDGRSDLLFQNQTTGRIAVWFMNGPHYQGGLQIPQATAGLQVAGVGDFNADGFADIVLQNPQTGQITIWFMNAATYAGQQALGSTLAPNWSVVGVGDYNRDGKADLLIQNRTSNQIAVWYLNGTLYQGGSGLSQSPPTEWKVVGPR
jgi:hypothetical protein